MSDIYRTSSQEEQYEVYIKNLSDEELVRNYRFHKDALMHDDSSASVMIDELGFVYEAILEEMSARYIKMVSCGLNKGLVLVVNNDF